MARALEEELAEYLLSLAIGPWTKRYNRECLDLWRATYGERVASKVEAILLKEKRG